MIRRERNSRRRLFKSSIKLEIRRRDVRAKKCTKSVIHVHSCCCANLNLSLFLKFLLPSPLSWLKLSFTWSGANVQRISTGTG